MIRKGIFCTNTQNPMEGRQRIKLLLLLVRLMMLLLLLQLFMMLLLLLLVLTVSTLSSIAAARVPLRSSLLLRQIDLTRRWQEIRE